MRRPGYKHSSQSGISYAFDMEERHPAKAFVYAFHADLSRWFTGDGDREAVWSRLVRGTSPDMVLVYPSGRRLNRAELLQSIEGLHGKSPGFEASISELELIRGNEDYAVVSYVETQTGARQSKADNQRSALAVIVRDGNEWRWRFIQETALDEDDLHRSP